MLRLKTPKNSLSLAIACFIILGLGLTISTTAYSQIGWIIFKSKTGLFELRIPKDHTIKTNRLRMGKKVGAESGEIIATVDQKPFKNAVKNYIVKYDQTFGKPLGPKERAYILKSEINAYEDYYEALNGVVKKRDQTKYEDQSSAELYITYEDPNLGLQSIRAFIKVTDTTKFQQILTGPDSIMYALESKNYFDFFKVQGGRFFIDEDYKKDLKKHTSPLKTFNVYLPDTDNAYFLKPHSVENNEKSELITFSFNDPMRKQQVFHRIFAYHFGTDLTYAGAKEVIFKRHTSRYFEKPTKIGFVNSTTDDGTPMVTAQTKIKGTRDYPYLNTLRIRALFADNYLMVHEVVGSNNLTTEGFTNKMLDTFVEFTPQAALDAQKQIAEPDEQKPNGPPEQGSEQGSTVE